MKNGYFPEDKIKKENTQMRSVWSIPSPYKDEKELGKHPTQKPLLLNSQSLTTPIQIANQ
jgi:site-specific DNA-methyltransferase (adenine-specific)